jgi:hypothetical protein
VRAGTVYEGVGVVMAEAMSEAELAAMEHGCAPTLADVIAAA